MNLCNLFDVFIIYLFISPYNIYVDVKFIVFYFLFLYFFICIFYSEVSYCVNNLLTTLFSFTFTILTLYLMPLWNNT